MDRDFYRTTWGQPLFEAIKVRSPGVDVEKFRELLHKTHAKWIAAGKIDVVPPKNLHALDDLLHKEHKDVFVLTSRTHGETKHLMEPEHVLAKRIKSFYYRELMVYHKPDPRAFDKLLSNHNLKPEECVYVGDAVSDARAAKGAGMHFIACLESGIRTKNDFKNEDVDLFINKFSELSTAIDKLQL